MPYQEWRFSVCRGEYLTTMTARNAALARAIRNLHPRVFGATSVRTLTLRTNTHDNNTQTQQQHTHTNNATAEADNKDEEKAREAGKW